MLQTDQYWSYEKLVYLYAKHTIQDMIRTFHDHGKVINFASLDKGGSLASSYILLSCIRRTTQLSYAVFSGPQKGSAMAAPVGFRYCHQKSGHCLCVR